MKLLPKKVELLLLEGTPYGLRYADLRNKTCRAFVAPRASFKDLLKREELERSGVYFLVGESDDSDLPLVYIGEADVLSQRLPLHNKKDFWSEIIVFVSQDSSLDKAGVRYIESILVQRAFQDKQSELQNGNSPAIKNLSEANISVMDEFIEDIVFLLSVLGYKIIRSKYQTEVETSSLLYAKGVGVEAKGRETDEGFVIYQGSEARVDETSTCGNSEKKARRKLIELEVLKKSENKYLFTQDYVFSSPSLAAGVVLGRNSNGRVEWKDKKGKTLKEIQEA